MRIDIPQYTQVHQHLITSYQSIKLGLARSRLNGSSSGMYIMCRQNIWQHFIQIISYQHQQEMWFDYKTSRIGDALNFTKQFRWRRYREVTDLLFRQLPRIVSSENCGTNEVAWYYIWHKWLRKLHIRSHLCIRNFFVNFFLRTSPHISSLKPPKVCQSQRGCL